MAACRFGVVDGKRICLTDKNSSKEEKLFSAVFTKLHEHQFALQRHRALVSSLVIRQEAYKDNDIPLWKVQPDLTYLIPVCLLLVCKNVLQEVT